jgi:hypothetical protein
VAVRGVDHEEVDVGRHEALDAVVVVDTDGRADAQAAALVGRGAGVGLEVVEVLHRDQPAQPVVAVGDDQLLDLVLEEQVTRLVERGPGGRDDEPLGGHHVGHGRVRPGLEAAVAPREDPDHGVALDDRQARDGVLGHDRARLLHRRAGRQRDRVLDDAVGGALDLLHLSHLPLDREVAVHDAEAPLAGERDGQPPAGDGVHRRRHQRDVERDVARHPGVHVGAAGEDVRVLRDQEDVVEGQAFERAVRGGLVRRIHGSQGARARTDPGALPNGQGSVRSSPRRPVGRPRRVAGRGFPGRDPVRRRRGRRASVRVG